MNKRLLSFGQSTVGLEYGEGRPARIVNFLFKNIPCSINEEPWTILRLEDHGQNHGIWLWQDETLLFKEESIESMAGSLMSQVCFTLAYKSKGGLLLHAAAVGTGESGMIIPGKSGAGKSTLTAWLIRHGAEYSSDEMVFVPSGSNLFSGFSRPLTIKSPARHLLPDLLKMQTTTNGMLQSELQDMIAPEQFGGQVANKPKSLDLLLFPHFESEQNIQLAALSRAQTAYELMRCLANARNLEDHGFTEAVRLAKSAPAYSLRFGDTEQAGRAIMRLVLA